MGMTSLLPLWELGTLSDRAGPAILDVDQTLTLLWSAGWPRARFRAGSAGP